MLTSRMNRKSWGWGPENLHTHTFPVPWSTGIFLPLRIYILIAIVTQTLCSFKWLWTEQDFKRVFSMQKCGRSWGHLLIASVLFFICFYLPLIPPSSPLFFVMFCLFVSGYLYVSPHSPFACPSTFLRENWVITSWLWWPKVNPAGSLRPLSIFSSPSPPFFLPFVRPPPSPHPCSAFLKNKVSLNGPGPTAEAAVGELSCWSSSASSKRALTVRKCGPAPPGNCKPQWG